MTHAAKPNRRELKFADLDDVLRDVEQLRIHGYDRAGNWDLAQVAGHLADWMEFPLDGYPRGPLPIRVILWVMKNTIARRQLRKVLAAGKMPANGPTFPETVPPPGSDEAAAFERLQAVARRFQAHTGPLQPSPMFGDVDRATALRMQLLHCSHHLGFLVSKAT